MDTAEIFVVVTPVRSMKQIACDVSLPRPFLPRFPRSACVQVPTLSTPFLQDTESIGSLPDTSPRVHLRRSNLLTFHSQFSSSLSPSASQDLQVLASPQDLNPRYLKDLVNKVSLASFSLIIADTKIKRGVNLSCMSVRYGRAVDCLKSIT